MSERRQINVRVDAETEAQIEAIRKHLATIDIRRCSASDAIKAAVDGMYQRLVERPRKRAS
jgi:hypothetical protein